MQNFIQKLLSAMFVLSLCVLTLMSGIAYGDTPTKAPEKTRDKLLSGMSIVGNDEAPKSLVIVPWKSSEIGDTLEVSRALDAGRQPVDRDVFQRALMYYEIQSGWDSGSTPSEN